MKNRTYIGIAMSDLRVLFACLTNADIDRTVSVLHRHYSTLEQAAALVNLGSLAVLGESPAQCKLDDAGPADPGICEDIMKHMNQRFKEPVHYHVFHEGMWLHWSEEPSGTMEFTEED